MLKFRRNIFPSKLTDPFSPHPIKTFTEITLILNVLTET